MDRLKALLMDWADWYRGDYGQQLGYNDKTPIIGNSASDDFESMMRKTEAQICVVIDVAINDLPQDQQCAIRHRYLAAVYHMRDYPTSLEKAHDRLMEVLPRKNVVI